MKKTRKPIALLLSVLMVLALFAPLSVVSFAEGDEPAVVASGDCGKNGNNMLYTLYSDGTMVLSGSGLPRQHSLPRSTVRCENDQFPRVRIRKKPGERLLAGWV